MKTYLLIILCVSLPMALGIYATVTQPTIGHFQAILTAMPRVERTPVLCRVKHR